MSAEQELSSLFVSTGTFCLNAKPSHPFSNLNAGGGLFLQSDTDEQILIHIVFQTAVRLSAISMQAPGDESAPTAVKLYANLPSPGFSDIGDTEISQLVPLSTADLTSFKKLPLKQAKFQRVNSLSLFIDENNGGEVTSLAGLKIFGYTLDGLDVGTIHNQHSHQH